MMSELANGGKYSFKAEGGFAAEYATIQDTFDAISDLYKETGYVMDTHTAVAFSAYRKYVSETQDKTANVIVSTASPYKFAKDVLRAIDDKYEGIDPFEALEVLCDVNETPIPEPIKDIDKREVLHKTVIDRSEIKDFVKGRLI